MKHDLTTMESGAMTGRQYWRSLDELTEQPGFQTWLHREFPAGASEAEGLNRRHFLKIMAASFGAAGLGLAGCRRPEANILPYAKQPEGMIPGLPIYYTTSQPDAFDNLPLVVETHGHRPTHAEGNRDYPAYKGGTSAQATASVLNLYDPDRLTSSAEKNQRVTPARVKDRLAEIHAKYAQTQGQGLAILAEPSTSPTRQRLVRELKAKLPHATWAEFEPLRRDGVEKALTELFGRPVRPVYQFKQAKRVLSLDADFLMQGPGAMGAARGFAASRKVDTPEEAKKMSRLYAVEANFSVTGAQADHRLRLASSQLPAFTAHLAAQLLSEVGQPGLAQTLRQQAGDLAVDAQWIAECAKDLLHEKGHSLIVAGAHLPSSVHWLVYLLNDLLEAPGHTVTYVEPSTDKATALIDLTASMQRGEVETLVVLGGNPVFNAPADLDFKGALGRVPEVVRYGYYYDETGLEADLNIAATHYLEGWGDGRTWAGDLVPVQPMLQPLFEGFNELEVVARLANFATTEPYALVLATYTDQFHSGAESVQRGFQRFLSQGWQAAAYPLADLGRNVRVAERLTQLGSLAAGPLSASALEVNLMPDYSIGDGFYANNGWLQELPDPMTKLTWDNAILVSPKLAQELGYDTKTGKFLIAGISKQANQFSKDTQISPLARLTVDGVTVEGPISIQPGLADYAVVVALGYGREKVGQGRVAQGCGFNAYPLTHSQAGLTRTGAKLELTGKDYRLANTAMHWSMEGRAIIREANAKDFAQDPEFAQHMGMESHSPPIYGKSKDKSPEYKALNTPRGGSLYETPNFNEPPPNLKPWQQEGAMEKFIPDQQWGMTIDLNTCTGCNACVVACQSENNIPIVGKEQIAHGREMHWIRLDRYFSSDDVKAQREALPSDPQASIMPVGCMHCEMAPCEQVCPVNATVHDTQGLNVMAYNRCVGTRYCANNCPYKVRRFNFFDYNKRSKDELYAGPLGTNQYQTEGGQMIAMQKNPDVTVRMRGVMEKCTYCLQRVQQARMAQKIHAMKDPEVPDNQIHIPDGVLRVACQSACPSDAIVFGDVSDPTSAVYKSKESPRDYALLGYLNTRPRTTYLARLRNPNPAMPDYTKPASYLEYKQMSKSPEGGHGGDHSPASHSDHSGAASDHAEPAHGGDSHAAPAH